MEIWLASLLLVVGTALGSFMVLFFRGKTSPSLNVSLSFEALSSRTPYYRTGGHTAFENEKANIDCGGNNHSQHSRRP